MSGLLDKFIKWGTNAGEVSGRDMPADYTPVNYIPVQVASEGNDKISAHYKGIDTSLGSVGVDLGSLSKYRSGLDADGIYTVVTYKRADGTKFMESTLSDGAAPAYSTRTVKYYDTDGTTELVSKRLIFTLTYTLGDMTSEVLI